MEAAAFSLSAVDHDLDDSAIASIFFMVAREPLNQSSAALSGSFAPTCQFENLEIRKGFLQFPNLNLETKSLAGRSCDLIRGSLEKDDSSFGVSLARPHDTAPRRDALAVPLRDESQTVLK